MININFQRADGDPNSIFDDILKEVKVDNAEIKKEVNNLASLAAQYMIAVIRANKKRPQNGEDLTLEDNIKFEVFEGGWGVGDIEELKKEAPYWAAINFGSSHMVGKRVPNGKFEPGQEQPDQAFFRNGRWQKGEGHFSFVVKNPIPAMNFVEKTVFWLSDIINKMTPAIKK